MPVEVTLRAGANGLGDLSDVHFVGAPLQVDPPDAATVTSGPVPPSPPGLTLAPGDSMAFDFELTGGDEQAWYELYSFATATDSAGNSVGESEAGPRAS